MSSEPPPVLLSRGPLQLSPRASWSSPASRDPSSFCSALRERLIRVAPLRQADALDVGEGGLGDGLVEVLRPGGCQAPASAAARCRSSSRRPWQSSSPICPHLLDLRIRRLAEVVPDRGRARDDVGLIAAVGDDVVRALLERQVLAAEVPADVHQLHGVERAAAAPRRSRRRARSRRGTMYCTDTRPVPARRPRTRPSSSSTCVNSATSTSLNKPGAHEVRLGADELLGRARPDPDRAGELLALHDLLHRDRRGDVERLPGVVPFAVARRAFDHRIVIGDAGLLRRLRNAVDVRAEREHRLARAPAWR